MKSYKIKILYFFSFLLWSILLFSCREDNVASPTLGNEDLQIYLQASNNKNRNVINNPIPILQEKFVTDKNDLFFAVATREVSRDTHIIVTTETDSTVIGRYKKEYGKSLPILPQGSYSLPESITIPAGKSISGNMLAITWKDPSAIKDKTATYLLAISIKSMDNKDATLTSNRNTIFVEVRFNEVSYSLKIKTGKTSDDLTFNKAGSTVVIKGANPLLLASVNSPINTDLSTKINIDNSLISTYNATNGTQFQILPENTYKLSTTSLSIPKNSITSNELEIQFTSAMSQLDISKQYLLPVKSTSETNVPTTNDVVYLKISIVENNINSNTPLTGTIIDRNSWSVKANSEYNSEYTAPMMLDGDYNTGWLADFSGNATITLDMSQSYTLKGFSITPTYINGNYALFPSKLVIYTSNDGINWTKQGVYENDEQNPEGNPQNPYLGWISFIEPVIARYIRFDEMEGYPGIGELNAIQ
ncbi:TPA: DUF1735 domain-containing protein [Elizabethkingia anophelis]